MGHVKCQRREVGEGGKDVCSPSKGLVSTASRISYFCRSSIRQTVFEGQQGEQGVSRTRGGDKG